MVWKEARRTVIVVVAGIAFYGCASPAKEAASPASSPEGPAPESAPGADADRSAPSPALVTPSSMPASADRGDAPRQPASSASPPSGDRRREAALRAARSEVDAASRELDLATAECGSACRALASMERATGHLCNLASDERDRRSCDDAKAKVVRARDRIRSSCGTCPDGTSLERSH